MDELFVEPEPLVEPYFTDLFMMAGFAVFLVGAFVLLADREERIAELALKNEAIESAPVGVTIADMTQDDEPLTFVNDTFTEQTGYDAAETVGNNCRFLQGEETDPAAVARMREAIDAGEPVTEVLRNYRKDGTPFWNQVSLSPIADADGAVRHYVGFQEDVTEREEYRRRLQTQRDDLDVLNQMVRHDIRNDLQVILAYLDIIGDRVGPDGQAELETVEESARNAIEITDTARDLSRKMLTDDADAVCTTRQLSEPLRSQLDDLRETYDGTFAVDGSIPDVQVTADDMLDSVFRNVLTNAVRHNDSETPEVRVSVTESADTVTVSIADNGPGVPDDLKGRIFDRGEKGADSEGTGIGTYLVDTLIEKYGGRVWIEDSDLGGADFRLELVKADGQEEKQSVFG